jgi:hypothetical protein
VISHSGRSWSENLNVIEISQFLIDARHYTPERYLLSMRLRFRFNRPFVVLGRHRWLRKSVVREAARASLSRPSIQTRSAQ